MYYLLRHEDDSIVAGLHTNKDRPVSLKCILHGCVWVVLPRTAVAYWIRLFSSSYTTT